MVRHSFKILISCLLIGLSSHMIHAQVFGNEWIRPNQNYYKFYIEETGVYRIFYSTLQDANFLTDNPGFNPRRLQIFRRGKELAITISDPNNNGVFDTNEYIEFYAEKNDGAEDSSLYINPEAQPHKYQSLFDDRAAYFLTLEVGAPTAKRMQSFFESNVTNIMADQHYVEKKVITFTNEYTEGLRYSSGTVKLSQYDVGEGWTDTRFRAGQNRTYTFSGLEFKNENGITPTLKFLLTGKNGNSKSLKALVGPDVNSLREVSAIAFDGYNSFEQELPIAYSDISTSGLLIVRFSMDAGTPTKDAAVSYLELNYSRSFEYNNSDDYSINLNTKGSGKSYFEINTTAIPTGILDITDNSNPIAIGFEQAGGQLKVVVDNTEQQRQLYLYRVNPFQGDMEKVIFTSTNPADFDYLMLTSERLLTDPTPVNTYKNYRESIGGGGFNVDLKKVEDLYNTFNYGDESPIAIRRYCAYMLNGGNPKFLFIIGRGLVIRDSYRRNNPARSTHFVPTFGFPGSDVPFTVGLKAQGTFVDDIPTGRINAESEIEITNYLNKVIEIESAPITDIRRKQLLHLSGGRSAIEQVSFKGFVDAFQQVAEGTLLGARISKKAKATTEAVELININEEINRGIALTTFFGHSSASAADIDVGLVSRVPDGYDNKGKYGFFLVHGCNAGDFYSANGSSFGDDWINTADLGIVGFIAHSDQGSSSQLRAYGNAFYDAAFKDPTTFGASIGEIRQNTIKKFFGGNTNPSKQQLGQAHQMVLLGDPAVRLFPTKKSEYEILDENVSISTFDNQQLLSTVDSFAVNLEIANYGRFDADSIEIKIRRELPDASAVDYPLFKVPSVANERLVSITIVNTEEQRGLGGINRFIVTIDPNDSIEEESKINNMAQTELFFAKGSTSNILPANLSIVGTTSVRIVTHPTDLINFERTIVIEIDDNPAFTSPLSFTKTSNPVINMEIALNGVVNGIADSTVIFWRTRLANPGPNESETWSVSSFTYIQNTTGWGQLNAKQYPELITDGLTFSNNIWEFDEVITNLDVQTNGAAIVNKDSVYMKFEGQDLYSEADGGDNPTSGTDNCRANTLNFVVFDKKTTAAIRPVLIDGKVVEFNEPRKCGKSPQSIYSFNNNELRNNDQNISDLFNAVDDGGFVLVFSVDSVNYDSIDAAVVSYLNNLGLGTSTLDNLANGESVILLGKKGSSSGSAIEIRGNNSNSNIDFQKISLNAQIEGNISDGTIESPVLGPAASWNRLTTSFVTQADDDNMINVIGIRSEGPDSILYSQSSFNDFDLSAIDTDLFPRLKLRAALSDPGSLTPPGFQWWTVTYGRVPEGILVLKEATAGNRTKEVKFTTDEGGVINQSFTFLNVSEVAFQDSVVIEHELKSIRSGNIINGTFSIAPPDSNSIVDFDIDLSTVGNAGINSFKAVANSQSRKEESFGNNIVSISEYAEVIGDETNPLLDVTFDGQYIFNNDIVSPNPTIIVRLRDDNPLLPKVDTTGVNLFLKQVCEECPDFSRVPFDDNKLSWTPGATDKNFEIDYRPGPLENGDYALRVQAADQTGNVAGTQPYEISFKVINESMISNFYPYPNPFSTSTRFVFTLTGNEIPEDIKIQIMTISGKVVREIFLDELGPVHIGNNISDYAWNGKDQYGDQLANGVYLYRVMIKNQGDNFKPFETSGDKAFKKGFGKMYLLK